MNGYELVLFFILLISHSVFLSITIYNLFTAPRIKNRGYISEPEQFVSILIPVRNEEKNIKNLLDSITQLSYQNYEVLVLDDNSQDDTFQIINSYLERNDKLNVMKGKELPDGWMGKNWACFQLADKAKGEWFLFLDADVTLAPNSLSFAVNLIERYNLNMLTCFPTQNFHSIGEWFIVPLMNWLLLTFLPLLKVLTLKNKNVAAANGQFILIEKQTYLDIGGHKSVKNEIVEDIGLARIIKQKRYRLLTTLGDKAVFCKMYTSLNEAFSGFSKNFFSGFGLSKIRFLLLIMLFLILFLGPFGFSFVNPIFILILVQIFFERLFVSLMSRQNWSLNIFLHPFQMLFMFWIGIYSLYSKEKFWKGRRIN